MWFDEEPEEHRPWRPRRRRNAEEYRLGYCINTLFTANEKTDASSPHIPFLQKNRDTTAMGRIVLLSSCSVFRQYNTAKNKTHVHSFFNTTFYHPRFFLVNFIMNTIL